jgi:hypothetical protein
MAEIDADRIEYVSQDARHGEKLDRAAIFYAGLLQMPFDCIAQAHGCCFLAVITIVEAEKVEAVVREQAKLLCQQVDFVEIKQQVEDAIAQPMVFGPQPVVHHRASV